jgi:hypothetical protein
VDGATKGGVVVGACAGWSTGITHPVMMPTTRSVRIINQLKIDGYFDL